jgi:suppressor of ftsI
MPIAFHDPKHRTELADHILVPPAIVTEPQPGAQASLRTLCFDTDLDGVPNPAMVLADMVDLVQPTLGISTAPIDTRVSIYKPLSPKLITSIENSAADFVVTFTEDKKGFYINGKKYGAMDPP